MTLKILRAADFKNIKSDSWLNKIHVLFGFAVILQVFVTHLKREIFKQSPIVFKCVSKTCKCTAKTKHNVVIIN